MENKKSVHMYIGLFVLKKLKRYVSEVKTISYFSFPIFFLICLAKSFATKIGLSMSNLIPNNKKKNLPI